jgi:hypothetical protein
MKMQTKEMMRPGPRSGLLSYLSLFTSLGTLLCCALPSLLVLLGLGATVASVLSSLSWLVALSHHKAWVFTVAGVLIALSFIQTYALSPRLRLADQACPPEDSGACDSASRLSKVLLWVAAVIYTIGFLVAYVLGPILSHLDAAM